VAVKFEALQYYCFGCIYDIKKQMEKDMSTALWFIPQTPEIALQLDGITEKYVIGRICGEAKKYGDSVGVISGEFALGTLSENKENFNNLIVATEEQFELIKKSLGTLNIALKLIVNETLYSSTFNGFSTSKLTLSGFTTLTQTQAYSSGNFPKLVNIESIEQFSDRNEDFACIINDFQSEIYTNKITHIEPYAHKIGFLLNKLLTCRHYDYLFEAYIEFWSCNEVNNKSYVDKIKNYLKTKIITGEKWLFKDYWLSAFHFDKANFEKYFKVVESTKDDDWEPYSFLKFAREKIILPIPLLAKAEFLNNVNYFSLSDVITEYKKLGIKSNCLENCIANVLTQLLQGDIDTYKASSKTAFNFLEFMAVVMGVLSYVFDYGFFIGFIAVNLIGLSVIKQRFKSSFIKELDYFYINLDKFDSEVRVYKSYGVSISSDLDKLISKI
jgi:hypothetical protein